MAGPGTAAGERAASATPLALLAAGLAVALLTWPVQNFGVVEAGDDGSWVIGLHMASRLGLDFGPEIVWTYGPLGFLTVPLLSYPLQAALSLLYAGIVHAALAVSVLWAARRSFPTVVALGLTVAACLLIPVTESDDRLSASVLIVVSIWSLAVIRARPPAGSPAARLFPLAAGLVAAVQALVRLNTGLTVVAMLALAIAVGFPERRGRALATFAAAFAAGSVGLWLATGQVLTDLPAYVGHAVDLVAGHSQALGTEDSPAWEYAVAALALGILAATARTACRSLPGPALLAALALAGLLLFSAFKQGFVRHDDSHAPFFFACALGAGLAFGWPRHRRRAGLAAAVALIAALAVVARPGAAALLPPERAPWQALRQARAVVTPGAAAHTRLALRGQEGLDARTAGLLRGRTVHVWPSEAAVAWAHPEIRWRPLPTVQANIAYTRTLDLLDARALSSPSAPERVLRAEEDQPFAAPAASTALFCHYAQVHAAGRWQVLTRVPDRCGPPRRIAVTRAWTGQGVRIPAAGDDEMVVASIRGLEPRATERLTTLLFRGPPWRASTDDSDDHNLAPGTAPGPLIVRIPPRWDYPGDFARGLDADELEITGGSWLTAQPSGDWRRPLVVEFYAVRLRAPGVMPSGRG